LPEVAGNAALLVDPLDVNDISSSITHLLTGPILGRTLVEKGLKRSLDFSWSDTAKKTLGLYHRIQ
jgi:alpha-1,3-rhamnosyl/mannosyltransferase